MSHSYVWQYFIISDADSSRNLCKICETEISRGGKVPKDYTTTNMVNHLKRHSAEYTQFIGSPTSAPDLKRKPASNQSNLQQCLEKKKKFDPCSIRAEEITNAIGWKLATDLQPFTISDSGFPA